MNASPLAVLEPEALELDQRDREGQARDRFVVPKDDTASGYAEVAYLAADSLGLQGVAVADEVRRELDDWATLAVEGHWAARTPWTDAHVALRGPMARIVGAREDEVVVMNSLTVNLHLLLATFYRPTPDRYRIVIEDAAFPSDSYAVRSQAAFHGYDPSEAIVRLAPRDGERLVRTEDVVEHLRRDADRTALVLLGGVNYRTGQLMEMAPITDAARSLGVTIGWDLAHAVGNVELALHEVAPDFAAWCTYKYLNGGPGATAGAFVHERHLGDASLPRLEGWWGTDPAVRLEMRPELTRVATADAWSVSCTSILSMAPLRVALGIVDELGMGALRARSVRLTGYLERLLAEELGDLCTVVSPLDPAQRGCQLSVAVHTDASAVADRLRSVHGVVCDARPPDVVRLAPAPLYTSFHDCWRAAAALHEVLA